MLDLRLQNKAHEVCSEMISLGRLLMSELRLQNKAHAVSSKLFLRVAHLSTLLSDLLLQNKAHEVSSELFLRVPQLYQIFAYRTRHTLCVVSYFFGSLTYVTSSLTEQGTRSV